MLEKTSLLLLLLAQLPLARADVACTKPNTAALINEYSKQHPSHSWDSEMVVENLDIETVKNFDTSKPAIQWAGIGWDAPPGGLLFAIACEGTVIDATPVGSVEEIKPGPSLPGIGDTVLVSATDGTGTGGVHKMISLFTIKDGHLINLWHHTLYESDYHQEGVDGEETDFLVTLLKNSSIDVFGIDRFFRSEGEEWSETPYKTVNTDEIYCWNSAHFAYADCSPKTTQR
jgi:hypothetical protein